jgi:hypothetical protein
VSGLGTLPAAGTLIDEKSGVSPGRNAGSGTCSANAGALRREGCLSAIAVPLSRVRGKVQIML